jgi:DNA-binding transcriptional ArsR family regulator
MIRGRFGIEWRIGKRRLARALLTGCLVSTTLRCVATYQDALGALADGTRRSIFERLAQGPQAVGELADGLPVSRPAVSQHLRVLKAAGLVTDHPAGTRRLYQLDPNGLGALRTYLDRFWEAGLAAFKAAIESDTGEET